MTMEGIGENAKATGTVLKECYIEKMRMTMEEDGDGIEKRAVEFGAVER